LPLKAQDFALVSFLSVTSRPWTELSSQPAWLSPCRNRTIFWPCLVEEDGDGIAVPDEGLTTRSRRTPCPALLSRTAAPNSLAAFNRQNYSPNQEWMLPSAR
jgi:hypothetical protein